MIEVFFIAIINLSDPQISPTQTFSFSVRIRREMDWRRVLLVYTLEYVNGLD